MRYDSMQWSSIAFLFSALSLQESTSSSSQRVTITNWSRWETAPAIYERARPDWFAGAKCRGICGHGSNNLFYADYQHNGQVGEAKSVCLGTHPELPGRCPVLDQCLAYALENGEKWGVWGGCSERERRAIRRARHREAALGAGKIVSIDSAPSGHRQKLARLAGNVQTRDPAPWRHSKSLIDQQRQQRATKRRAASLGDLALGMVSEG
jgi:WhiB family redox-sensing transcriptional regulator